MKKSQLRSGYKLVVRANNSYIVLLNTERQGDCAVGCTQQGWLHLDNYREDLTTIDPRDAAYDVMDIYKPEHISCAFLNDCRWELIWSRDKVVEPRNLTQQEIEKLLGYPIKIITEETL